jgi:hypothetical protein
LHLAILFLLASFIFTVLIGLFRPKRVERTESIGVYFKENTNMAAPGTGTTPVGTNVSAGVQPLLADGAVNFAATVTATTWTIDNPAVATFTTVGATTISITPVAVGTANVSVTATVVDSDQVTNTFTATGVLTVTENTSGVRTASLQIVFS